MYKNATKKRLVSIALIFAMLFAQTAFTFAAQETVSFNDISGHWAVKAIITWAERGVVTGYPDQTFKPDAFITRAELASVYASLLRIKGDGKTKFMDVKEFDWFFKMVDACRDADVVNGYPDNTFRPAVTITRQDAFLINAVALGIISRDHYDLDRVFTDAGSVGNYAKGTTQALYEEAIITGYPDKTVRPLRQISRAELVQILSTTITSFISKPGTYEAKPGERILVVDSTDVTITGHASAIVITGAVDGGTVNIKDAEVDNAVISYASDADITIENSDVGGVKITGVADDDDVIIKDSTTGDIRDQGEDTTIKIDNSQTGDIYIDEKAEGAHVEIENGSQTGNIDDAAPDSVIDISGNSKTGDITLEETAENAEVNIEDSKTGDITDNAPDSNVNIKDSETGDIDLGETADNAELIIENSTTGDINDDAPDSHIVIKDSETGDINVGETADNADIDIENSHTGDITDDAPDSVIDIKDSETGDITLGDTAENAEVNIDHSKTGDIDDSAPNSDINITNGSETGDITIEPGADGTQLDIDNSKTGDITDHADDTTIHVGPGSQTGDITIAEDAENTDLDTDKGSQTGDITIAGPNTDADIHSDTPSLTVEETAEGSDIDVYKDSTLDSDDITDNTQGTDDPADITTGVPAGGHSHGPVPPTDPRDPADVQAEIDQLVQGGMMNVYVKADVQVDGAGSAKVSLKNNNTFDVHVAIETGGTEVYSTDMTAGQQIDTVTIAGLSSGVHAGTATFTNISTDNGGGKVVMSIILTVQ